MLQTNFCDLFSVTTPLKFSFDLFESNAEGNSGRLLRGKTKFAKKCSRNDRTNSRVISDSAILKVI